MRATILAGFLGLAALPAMAGVPAAGGAAASPVSTQPLAANEVLVELIATGDAVTRADLATITVEVVGRGADDEAARAAYQALTGRIRAAARSAGVAAGDIEVQPPVSLGAMTDDVDLGIDTSTDTGPDPGATPPGEAATKPSYAVQGQMTMRLRDVARVPALEQAVREVDPALAPGTAYRAGDDAPARRAARAEAIAAARADAEGYAAAINMRVARIVRITERVAMDLMGLMFSNPGIAQQMEHLGEPQGPDIAVRVFVGVDFALAPR